MVLADAWTLPPPWDTHTLLSQYLIFISGLLPYLVFQFWETLPGLCPCDLKRTWGRGEPQLGSGLTAAFLTLRGSGEAHRIPLLETHSPGGSQ